MYVVLKENSDRAAIGLSNAGLSCPLLVVNDHEAELTTEEERALGPPGPYSVDSPSSMMRPDT